MNSFASIYFHNYLRFDEMPVTKKPAKKPKNKNGKHNKNDKERVRIDLDGETSDITSDCDSDVVLSPSAQVSEFEVIFTCI